MIDLDNQLSTSPCQIALDKVRGELLYASSFAYHLGGKKARVSIEESKKKLLSYLGGDQEEVIASDSYTEILQTFVFSLYEKHLKASGRNQILRLALQSGELREAFTVLTSHGCLVKEIPLLSSGQVDLIALRSILGPKVGAISMPYADDYTGIVYPVEEISLLCKERGIFFHLDITGILGKLSFIKRDLAVDAITLSGKGFHALTSLGVLITHEKFLPRLSITPFLFDGFVAALQQSLLFLDRMGLEVARLRSVLEEGLSRRVGAMPLGIEAIRLPHITALVFPRVHRESLGFLLQERGILVNLQQGASTVINPLKTGEGFSHLSFALSRLTTEKEILVTIAEIEKAYNELTLFTKGLL